MHWIDIHQMSSDDHGHETRENQEEQHSQEDPETHESQGSQDEQAEHSEVRRWEMTAARLRRRAANTDKFHSKGSKSNKQSASKCGILFCRPPPPSALAKTEARRLITARAKARSSDIARYTPERARHLSDYMRLVVSARRVFDCAMRWLQWRLNGDVCELIHSFY